ncbi:MAG: DNA-processing protein DprA, partial [Opitutales bacterium]|nr:DNA-processing protein DprA [Opitutales bacterium]
DCAGGSIITANFAADCGRTVFAFPGRVEQPGSRGCHKLIREGATLATCAADIIEDLSETPVQQMLALEEPASGTSATRTETGNLSAEAQKILALLRGGEALSPDALSAHTGLPFPLVSATLLLLELDRIVARKADGSYEIS